MAEADKAALDVLGDTTPAFTLAYLRSSPDCVKLLNTVGRISFMSENGMCAMELGSPADVVGKAWWELWPVNSQNMIKAQFDKSMLGEICRFTGSCPTGSGEMRDWDITVSPVQNEDGSITSVLAVSRDITPMA